MENTSESVASLIDQFLDGSAGEWDWDDFISIPLEDPELERARRLAASLPDTYPPTQPGHYCGEQGMVELRSLSEDLRRASRERR